MTTADDDEEDEGAGDFLGESLGWIPERIIIGTDKRGRKYGYDTDLKKRVSLKGKAPGKASVPPAGPGRGTVPPA